MLPYTSPMLFHGPSARDAAMAIVPRLGRLIAPPFGEQGLKIAESREIVDLMESAAVGDQPGVVVMGPMDRATRASQDVLLKNIEEFDDRLVRPVLWARDEAAVISTIRSRCLRTWCPGTIELDEDATETGRLIVDCVLARDVAGIIEHMKDANSRAILEAAAYELSLRGIDDRTADLWGRLREVLRFKTPSWTEAVAAFLPERAA